MNKSGILLVCVLFSGVTAFAVMKLTPPTIHGAAQHQETSYERVIRTGILRCGYEYWDGAVMRDEKTGEIYGPWPDLMKALGKAAGLKIDWTAQVGWGDVAAALKANKIDAMCAGMWTSAEKAKEIYFSSPLAYQALEAFVRADDHRFDGDLRMLNDPSVKIVVIENDNTDFLTQSDFPKAQRLSLSTLNGTDSEEMMNVAAGKADVCFTVAGQEQQFSKANPRKVRPLAPDHKLRVFGLANAINNDDEKLLQLLNAAEQEIQNSGALDRILDQANHDWPDMYIKPLKPFP